MFAEFILAGWLSSEIEPSTFKKPFNFPAAGETKSEFTLVIPEGSYPVYSQTIDVIESQHDSYDPNSAVQEGVQDAYEELVRLLRKIYLLIFGKLPPDQEQDDTLVDLFDSEQEGHLNGIKPVVRLILKSSNSSASGKDSDPISDNGDDPPKKNTQNQGENKEGKEDEKSDAGNKGNKSDNKSSNQSVKACDPADGINKSALQLCKPTAPPDFSEAPDHIQAYTEQLIDFYKKQKMVISSGSYAEVAWDQYPRSKPQMHVAVKYNRGQKEGAREGEQMITYLSLGLEADILKKLDHFHIVRMIYMLSSPLESRILLFLEFYPYGMRSVIEAPEVMAVYEPLNDLMTPVGLLLAVESLIEALLYLHKQGWLYPDLKSTNIMFDNKGVLKLVDFNILCKRSELARLTSTYCCYYLAPEIRQELYFNELAESYSVGLLLMQLLTGLYLECCKNISDQLAIKSKEVDKHDHLSSFLSSEPEAIRLFLARVLDDVAYPACRDLPADRPTIEEMCIELDKLVTGMLDYLGEHKPGGECPDDSSDWESGEPPKKRQCH